MIYAQISNGIIVNIIELDDSSLSSLFSEGFDLCLRTDNLSPTPQIGWYYDIPSSSFYPPTTLALIQNNVVTSVIQNCDAYITNNSSSYQYIVDITTMNPQPQTGWTYSGSTFTPSQAYYQNLAITYISFGNQVVSLYSAANFASGITTAGQTAAFISYTSLLFSYLYAGYLDEAISEFDIMIADTSSTKTNLSPFITNDILVYYKNLLQSWMNILLT